MLSGKIYYELIKLKNAKLAIWTTQGRIYITDRRTYSLPFFFWSFLNIDLGFKILKSLGTRARGTMYVAGLRRCFRRESHWTTLLSCIILEREQSALPASRIGTLRLYQKQQRMEKKKGESKNRWIIFRYQTETNIVSALLDMVPGYRCSTFHRSWF